MARRKWTIESFEKAAKKLRNKADEWSHKFFQLLLAGEKENFWREVSSSYDLFLSSYNICKGEYARYKRGADRIGKDAVSQVSTHAVISLGHPKITDAEARSLYSQYKAWEDTNGTAIGKNEAEHILRASLRPSKPKKQGSRISELLEENKKLRAENERLKQENLALRAELRTYKQKAKQPRGRQQASA